MARTASARRLSSQRGLPVGTPSGAERAILAGITVLAAALRFAGLGSQSLWLDEGYSWRITDGSLGSVLGNVKATESTPPLYYWLNWFFVHLFGASEVSLRLLSALAGTGTVIAVWYAARRLVNPAAGLIAGALVACSPYMWWFSQEARAYSLAAFLCAAALAGFAARVRGGGRLALAVWSLCSALSVLTQYSAAACVAATLLILLVADRSRARQTILASSAPVLAGVAMLPLFLEQNVESRTGWVESYSYVKRVEALLSQAWANSVFEWGSPHMLLGAVGFVAVTFALVVVGRRADPDLKPGVAMAGWVLLVSGACLLAVLNVGGDRMLPRYWIIVWPAGAVAAGAAIGSIRSNAQQLGIAGGLCAAMLAMIAVTLSDSSIQKVDWRGLAAVLGPTPPSGRVVVTQGYDSDLPLAFYLEGTRFLAWSARTYPNEVDVVTLRSSRVSPAMGIEPKTTMIGSYPLMAKVSSGKFTVFRFLRPARPRLPISAAVIAYSLAATIAKGSALEQLPVSGAR